MPHRGAEMRNSRGRAATATITLEVDGALIISLSDYCWGKPGIEQASSLGPSKSKNLRLNFSRTRQSDSRASFSCSVLVAFQLQGSPWTRGDVVRKDGVSARIRESLWPLRLTKAFSLGHFAAEVELSSNDLQLQARQSALTSTTKLPLTHPPGNGSWR